ncbi:MAG: hypothetical protein CL908_13825 [Deltaproteobacteria bacterium]|nr:hypothetical protein [Deltaproteobacteria bacterium]
MSIWRSTEHESSTSGSPAAIGRSLRGLRLLVASLLAGVGIGLATSPSIAAEEIPEGWSPALRLGVALHLQGLDGAAVSPDSLDPIRIPPTTPGEPDRSSGSTPGDSAQTAVIRAGLRIYAPEDLLGERAYAPRLFLQAGFEKPLDDGFVASRYNFDFDVFDLGDITGDVSDFCPEAPPTTTCSYEGRILVDILANWHFGLGADFRLPIADGQYHVVPTLEYFGQAFEAEGSFGVTLAQSQGGTDDVRMIAEKSDTEIVHGVAAGLGLEVDVWQADWLAAKLFLNSRAAWILTDRETNFSGMNPTPTVNFNQADFTARPSGFIVTTGAGIEFRWTGR